MEDREPDEWELAELTRNSEELPSWLMEDIGLSDKASNNLVNMNDGLGYWKDNSQSFTQIADWIETNVGETEK